MPAACPPPARLPPPNACRPLHGHWPPATSPYPPPYFRASDLAPISPHPTHQAVEEAQALGALDILAEDAEWLVVLKPAGLPVREGRRSLANMLRGMQATREPRKAVGGGVTDAAEAGAAAAGMEAGAAAAGAAAAGAVVPVAAVPVAAVPGAADERRPAEPARSPETPPEPWTVAYGGDARVGGCWVVAKSAASALALLDGQASVWLGWRCVLRGVPSAAALRGIELGEELTSQSADGEGERAVKEEGERAAAEKLAEEGRSAAAASSGGAHHGEFGAHHGAPPALLRTAPSRRFENVSEVRLTLPAHSAHLRAAPWARIAAASGHALIGGGGRRRGSAADGPRTECAWVEAVRIERRDDGCGGAGGGAGGGVRRERAQATAGAVLVLETSTPPPARFERLFAVEARVWAMQGVDAQHDGDEADEEADEAEMRGGEGGEEEDGDGLDDVDDGETATIDRGRDLQSAAPAGPTNTP